MMIKKHTYTLILDQSLTDIGKAFITDTLDMADVEQKTTAQGINIQLTNEDAQYLLELLEGHLDVRQCNPRAWLIS